MAEEFELDIDDLKRRMDGAMATLRQEFASLRTGRASASMLEPVKVDAYGQQTPINQLGTVNVPEPRMVTINVWDKGMVGKVEKAIRESGPRHQPADQRHHHHAADPRAERGAAPRTDKVAAHYAENARVAIRNVRRDGMDQLKRAKGDGLSEDDQKIWADEVQEMTDKHIAAVDSALENKQEEIMQV